MSGPLPKLLAEWFWTDRWMGSSGFLLPLEARGLYREMLTQAWRRGARLPNDHDGIRRAVGCTLEEWGRAWPAVSPYWRIDGRDLVNDTQLEIYTTTQARFERTSTASKRANAARWSGAVVLRPESGRISGRTPTGVRSDIRSESPPDPDPDPDLEDQDQDQGQNKPTPKARRDAQAVEKLWKSPNAER